MLKINITLKIGGPVFLINGQPGVRAMLPLKTNLLYTREQFISVRWRTQAYH